MKYLIGAIINKVPKDGEFEKFIEKKFGKTKYLVFELSEKELAKKILNIKNLLKL